MNLEEVYPGSRVRTWILSNDRHNHLALPPKPFPVQLLFILWSTGICSVLMCTRAGDDSSSLGYMLQLFSDDKLAAVVCSASVWIIWIHSVPVECWYIIHMLLNRAIARVAHSLAQIMTIQRFYIFRKLRRGIPEKSVSALTQQSREQNNMQITTHSIRWLTLSEYKNQENSFYRTHQRTPLTQQSECSSIW